MLFFPHHNRWRVFSMRILTVSEREYWQHKHMQTVKAGAWKRVCAPGARTPIKPSNLQGSLPVTVSKTVAHGIAGLPLNKR
ncbi:hypothetical protein [Hydrogenophaga sp. PAMC20947]|uniref:hypothetical protein n=1 Tax=Hydrogenophaga sp. PAMC20947 TaxID=2565558 RepID=UPI00109DD9AC|nr:hypothetical protein [Hydrogenophaga sp. PAMC20947]QCB44657.1 hypothetical protein E5678_00515 [Hydrogenophaga sp. PAMC20947]